MTELDAIQSCLAGEHAAVYVYGVLGGRAARVRDDVLRERLGEAYAAHRERRDALEQRIRSMGGEPVASEVAYELSGPALTATQLTAEAAQIEGKCAAVYAEAVVGTTAGLRRWVIEALVDASVRALDFDAAPEAFPGLAEL